MPRTRFVFVSILAALVLAACADVDDATRAVDQAESEVGFHYLVIQRSQSLVEAQHELDRHAAAIDSTVLQIRSRLDESCEGAGNAVLALETRAHAYLADAKQMPDVGTWRGLTTTYLVDMDGRFEILRGDLRCDR